MPQSQHTELFEVRVRKLAHELQIESIALEGFSVLSQPELLEPLADRLYQFPPHAPAIRVRGAGRVK